MKVSEVMTTDLVTVTPETALRDAAQLMLERGVSGLPVVDADGLLVGIVTEADFVDEEAAHAWAYRRSLLDPLFGRGTSALTSAQVVADVMSRNVATVRPDLSLAAAARLMATRRVKRLPVMDDDGHLVGIVSRADVMKAFVREDHEIAADVNRLLDGRTLPIDPATVNVTVDDGAVTLAGEVDSRIDARVLIDFVEHLDGVITVHNRLSWLVDDRRAAGGWAAFAQEGTDR